MPAIDCRTQPKITYIDKCPICEEKSCNNGFCDCGSKDQLIKTSKAL